MKNLTKKIELLAPAKDLECGIAAIDCGADAVYIGAPSFGARDAAGNSIEDIAKLAGYAHKFWAKVYVTVNILLHDAEINPALDMISSLYEAKVDGIIVQDVGLLECDLPPIPIIASTQMHNNTPEKVSFLEKIGIRRAILARELDIEQIKAIRKKTNNIELECFVHGALCVSYSGQCYLSYALGGRSGNRGKCAQPCRKAYLLIDASGRTLLRNKHLLSLCDLNLSENIGELIDAGITAFKIEGRLKDKAYVSNVVSFYRSKIDAVIAEKKLKKASSGTSTTDFVPDVNKTFNRGYTHYFLHGRDEKIGSIYTPKMIGEPVGKIIYGGKQSVTLDSKIKLHAGDGICFFDKTGNLRGTVVNSAKGSTFFPDKTGGMQDGILVYRNHDHEFISKLNKSRAIRQMSVKMLLSETDNGFKLSAVDEDGNSADFSIECEKEAAQKPESAVTNIRKQLMKSGNTGFVCSGVKIELNKVYFVAISVLNTLRRGVLESLADAREKKRPVCVSEIEQNEVEYPQKELTYTGNVLNRCAYEFYQFHGVESIEPAAESGLDMCGRQVMTTRYCLKHQLNLCPKRNKAANVAEPLVLVDEEGHHLELKFNCAKCEMEVYLKAGN